MNVFAKIGQRHWLILSVIFVTVFIDQIAKVVARRLLGNGETYRYLNDLVVFQHHENRGAFLSLGASLSEGAQFWIFTVIVSLFLMGILVYVLRDRTMPRSGTLAMTLVIAGGIGNLIDRIDRGSVTDFLIVGWHPLRTGVINIADMAITYGVIVMLLQSFTKEQKAKA